MSSRASSKSGAVGFTMVVSVGMEVLRSLGHLHCATVSVVLPQDEARGLSCVALAKRQCRSSCRASAISTAAWAARHSWSSGELSTPLWR